jgi:hypothetical protein
MPMHVAEPVSTDDLVKLLATLVGPVEVMLSAVADGAVGVMRTLLDQAFEHGRAAGLADAEHRVSKVVGTRAVDTNGIDGVLVRCGTCGGDGLLVQADQGLDPGAGVYDPAATAIIPKIGNDPTATTKFYMDPRRRD